MRGQQTCHRYILGTLRSNDATATRINEPVGFLVSSLNNLGSR